MIPFDKIENTETCFLQLWLMLDNTRQELWEHCKRYCISNVLKSWFGHQATPDFIWEVCNKSEQLGLNELPAVTGNPLPHREFLRATVSTVLKKGMRQINLRALDAAYSIAYPNCTPLNINKKAHPP